ncbi:MAG: DMT family transporter [Alphaproteobacteria bacterium]|jgi:drug/metabolite transporter (DMT)-like permease|nr:DMT family transporter [Alphaproteobacteria bacterium]
MKNQYNKFLLNDSLFGASLVLLATLLLSFRSILVKLVYIEEVTVMDLFYYRFLFTLPLLLGFAFYKKKKELFTTILNKKIAISCILAGFFGYYLATLSDFHSLKLIDANINRIILYTFPAYVLILNSVVEKRLPGARDIFFFALVQIGLFFVLGGFNLSLTSTNKTGAVLALLAAISYSIYIIINQQTGKKIGSILFTTYAVTFSFIFINIHFFIVFNPEVSNAISNKGFIIIVIMAIFCTFMPLLLIAEGIKRIGASRFALLNTSGPVMTIFFCFIILGETMTYQQIIGSILIIGVLYIAEKNKKKS